MADIFGRSRPCLPDALGAARATRCRLHETEQAARAHGLTPLATGDVLYHHPTADAAGRASPRSARRRTIDELGFRRERNADRHLQPPDEMARRFRDHPQALAAVEAIVERCTFSLRELRLSISRRDGDERPHAAGGARPAVAERARAAASTARRPSAYTDLLDHELGLVAQMDYAPYFLTVNSIVSFARWPTSCARGAARRPIR